MENNIIVNMENLSEEEREQLMKRFRNRIRLKEKFGNLNMMNGIFLYLDAVKLKALIGLMIVQTIQVMALVIALKPEKMQSLLWKS